MQPRESINLTFNIDQSFYQDNNDTETAKVMSK